MKKIMSANEIAEVLMVNLYHRGHSPISTGFVGMGLGECDVISITKAGFVHEFEIKRSRADFLVDFKKSKHKSMAFREGMSSRVGGWYKCANYFSFVTPIGLIQEEDIPEYAGLIWIDDKVVTIRRSPRIHSTKASVGLYKGIAHNLMCKYIFGSSYMTYQQRKHEKSIV